MCPKFTPDQDRQIASEYAAGESSLKLAKRHGCSSPLIIKVVRRAGTAIRRCNDYKATRKHFLDEDFFEVIDTPEKAWVLGWIVSDGNVHTKSGQTVIQISLARTDREVLETIRHIMKYEKPIYDFLKIWKPGHVSEMSLLSISSVKMVGDLARLGVRPRKSKTSRPPIIPQQLEVHFWQGVFEGDGYICRGKKACCSWSMGVVGSYWICHGFSRFIHNCLGVSVSVRRHSTIWDARCDTRDGCMKIAEFIYKDAVQWLIRKRDVVPILMRECQESISQRPWGRGNGVTSEQLLAAFRRLHYWSKVADEFGLNRTTIGDAIKKFGIQNHPQEYKCGRPSRPSNPDGTINVGYYARLHGIPRNTLEGRLKKGEALESAIETIRDRRSRLKSA